MIRNNPSFVVESKQIVPVQNSPLGAVWSVTILFAHAFLVSGVLDSKLKYEQWHVISNNVAFWQV